MINKSYLNLIILALTTTILAQKSYMLDIQKIITKQKLIVNQNRTSYIKEIKSLGVPSKISNCKAKLDDGSTIDLTYLDNVNSPK